MPRIAIGDCQLYYERHGAGFPVVFVSGLNGYGAYWRDQIPSFAKRFEVITHDHRGIGQSDHCRVSYTVERMATDVIELMDALGIDRAHVVGHSTGGAIAQILALQHPKRLANYRHPQSDDSQTAGQVRHRLPAVPRCPDAGLEADSPAIR